MSKKSDLQQRCIRRFTLPDNRQLELWKIGSSVASTDPAVKYRVLLDGILIAWTRYPHHTEEKAHILFDRELEYHKS